MHAHVHFDAHAHACAHAHMHARMHMYTLMHTHAHAHVHTCRSVKTTNAAFQQRVAAVSGGIEFLELCGFKVRVHLPL